MIRPVLACDHPEEVVDGCDCPLYLVDGMLHPSELADHGAGVTNAVSFGFAAVCVGEVANVLPSLEGKTYYYECGKKAGLVLFYILAQHMRIPCKPAFASQVCTSVEPWVA